MIATFLIALGFIAGTLFALPTGVPEIRKRAQQRPAFRKRLRIACAIITLLIIFGGLAWGMAQFYTQVAKCNTRTVLTGGGNFSTINCDTTADLTLLPLELWLRTLLPPTARATCIVGGMTCEVITEYQVFTSANAINTWSAYWGLSAAAIIGAVVNWAVLSFFTRAKGH
jgi:hypothetical protein